jgi:hypothetical protein
VTLVANAALAPSSRACVHDLAENGARRRFGPTVLPMTTLAQRASLHPIFALDALLAAGMGLVLVAFASPLFALAGGGLGPDALRLVGLGLLPWSAHNWITAREAPLGKVNPVVQLVGDTLWVLASVALCVAHRSSLSSLGMLLYTSQLVGVAVILAMKVRLVTTSPRR